MVSGGDSGACGIPAGFRYEWGTPREVGIGRQGLGVVGAGRSTPPQQTAAGYRGGNKKHVLYDGVTHPVELAAGLYICMVYLRLKPCMVTSSVGGQTLSRKNGAPLPLLNMMAEAWLLPFVKQKVEAPVVIIVTLDGHGVRLGAKAFCFGMYLR